MCLRNFNWINPSDYLCIMRTSGGVCATILTVDIIRHNNSHVVSQWFGLSDKENFKIINEVNVVKMYILKYFIKNCSLKALDSIDVCVY